MATTLQELSSFLDSASIKHSINEEQDILTMGFQTEKYKDKDGDKGIGIAIKLKEDGKYFTLFSPLLYKVPRDAKHKVIFLTLLYIQRLTKLLQYEYDPTDGEIKGVIEFPLEDALMTKDQLLRCVYGMVGLAEDFHEAITYAIKKGKFSPSLPAPELASFSEMLQMMKNSDDDQDSGFTE